jgi:hypothetical protein
MTTIAGVPRVTLALARAIDPRGRLQGQRKVLGKGLVVKLQ